MLLSIAFKGSIPLIFRGGGVFVLNGVVLGGFYRGRRSRGALSRSFIHTPIQSYG